jgi:hypothetical protein
MRGGEIPMAKCEFTLPGEGDINALLARARSAIEQNHGTFDGDPNQGSFTGSTFVGKVAGTYLVQGSDIRVQITEKPFMLSCSQIESALREFFR